MRFIYQLSRRPFSPRIFLFSRYVNTNTPRVRFAPSPTGYLHLGGLRTALYNYLFAKSRGGTFILRIEDTDQARKVEGSVDGLIRDLEWAGIVCDEGPSGAGECGPYVQSERLAIYQEHIEKLLANGSAYRCFCTERRLNIIRRDAVKSQRVPKYDNRCRSLSKEDIAEKISAGAHYCIRFKLTSDCLSFEDLVFGGVAYDVARAEGDPVLLKSDGYPTYHLASVVDDRLMRVTHVLRGVEWQISTTKHLLLYRAFGWQPPQFGHLPLIVNSDGTKLSKRQSDVRVDDYRRNGTPALALVNYITLSGGGFEHVVGAGVRIKTMEQLASEFDIDRISSHPSRLNPDLLAECNRLELKRQLHDDKLARSLVSKLQQLLTETYPTENLNIQEDHVKSVLDWCTSRVSKIEELATPKFGFLWVLPRLQEVGDNNKVVLQKLLPVLETASFEEERLKEVLRQFASDSGVQFAALMRVLRGALSGRGEGPGVAEMMALLGREQTMHRLRAVAARATEL